MFKTICAIAVIVGLGGWGYINLKAHDKNIGDLVSSETAAMMMENLSESENPDIKDMQRQAQYEADRMMKTGDFSKFQTLMQETPMFQ